MELAADLDHWNDVSVPFAMAEACFEDKLVVHRSEPGRSDYMMVESAKYKLTEI